MSLNFNYRPRGLSAFINGSGVFHKGLSGCVEEDKSCFYIKGAVNMRSHAAVRGCPLAPDTDTLPQMAESGRELRDELMKPSERVAAVYLSASSCISAGSAAALPFHHRPRPSVLLANIHF